MQYPFLYLVFMHFSVLIQYELLIYFLFFSSTRGENTLGPYLDKYFDNILTLTINIF
jgi:hypothetical protein